MEIAGIRIAVTSDDLPVAPVTDLPYAAFYKRPAPAAHHPDMKVNLTTAGMPDTGAMTQLFDSGESWSMFSRDEDYFLLFHPAAFGRPVWLARFDRSVENVTIFCSDLLICRDAGTAQIANPVRYPLDQLLLMYYLAPRQGLLLHAAAMAAGDRCLVFPGKSGAGKSTLSRQLIEEGAAVLTDDRVILKKTPSGVLACGTPWPGDAGVAINVSRKLTGIFFIRHGAENAICGISKKEALERLLPVTSVAWYDRDIVNRQLDFCDQLIAAVPTGEVHFKPGTRVGPLLHNFITA